MQLELIANQLSAISTAIEDASVEAYGDLSPSAVAALLTMRKQRSMSIGAVAGEIRLSHSATVRLIDKLEKEWLVRRQKRRGREVMVELTARGKRRASDLAQARQHVATKLLESLEEGERQQLSSYFNIVLGQMDSPACARFCESNPMSELEMAD
ncbi:hypothetical protein E1162_10445 [Rhodobacteraceae bacterium RKSG542]|uniref:MarR family winged helix-turn-helix transcriptional regulator n=1 Tax=Pseudovibrio flavus TaxID=2529854 RepID=UPI0012BD7098|nr:MarR family transcriptional regulator [Pseudovibrio flavus]MTI17658.1 hypothetical protein [Pseudovibrio flavus]